MADNLSTQLSTWRNSNQGGEGHNGLLSKININGALYDIKDPAVEYLAGEIQNRLNSLETATIRTSALAKPNDAAKFATSVTQGTDGQIEVTYGTIRDAELTSTATSGQVVMGIAQTVDGVVSATMGAVDAQYVTVSTTGVTSTTVQGALTELANADAALIGTSSDASSANTIYGAKAYADEAVANLAGQDWEQNAKKVAEIIEELESSENGNQWLTAIDKLSGMSIAGKTATAGDAIEYNEALTGAIKPGTTLTAAQASAVNTAVSGANYEEGQAISSAHAASYNATLDGAIAAGATYTDTNVTVKEYVDSKVAAAESAASGGISDLDSEVASSNVTLSGTAGSKTAALSSSATGTQVGVFVREVDGVVTTVEVLTNDLASAADLQTLDGAAVKTINGVTPTTGSVTLYGSDIALNTGTSTKLDTAISNLDSNKANKAAIVSSNINNWSASYASETLTWTNTTSAVYVPVSGQSL